MTSREKWSERLSGQQGRWEGESGQTETSTMCDPLNLKDLVEKRSRCLCCCSDHPSTFTSLSACRRSTPSILVRVTVGLNSGEGGEGVRCKYHSQILILAFVPASGHGLFSQNWTVYHVLRPLYPPGTETATVLDINNINCSDLDRIPAPFTR